MDYRCCDLLLSLLRITLCQNLVRHLVLEDFSDDCRVSCCQSSSETVSALRRPNWKRFLHTNFSVLHTNKYSIRQ